MIISKKFCHIVCVGTGLMAFPLIIGAVTGIAFVSLIFAMYQFHCIGLLEAISAAGIKYLPIAYLLNIIIIGVGIHRFYAPIYKASRKMLCPLKTD